jgi:hypothetical protein
MAIYSIRVTSNVDTRWADWFDGLTITNVQPGVTVISGEFVDQAALHGTLNKIRDLNLALNSVTQLNPSQFEPSPHIHR